MHASTFFKAREKLQQEYSENNRGVSSQRRIRATDFNDINESVYKWFLELGSQDIPVSGPVLCTETKDFAVIYGIHTKFKTTEL